MDETIDERLARDADSALVTVDELVLEELGLRGRDGHSIAGDQYLPPDPTIGVDREAAVARLHEAIEKVHALHPDDLAPPRPTLTNAAQRVAEYDTEDPNRFLTYMATIEVIGAHMAMAILDESDEEREERAQHVAATIREQLTPPRALADLPRQWRHNGLTGLSNPWDRHPRPRRR